MEKSALIDMQTDLHEETGRLCNAIMSAKVFDDLLQLSDSDDEIESKRKKFTLRGNLLSIHFLNKFLSKY